MVVLLELWPDVSRSLAKLRPFRRSMLGRGSYLVNYLEGISRMTEEVPPDPGRWVPHPCVFARAGFHRLVVHGISAARMGRFWWIPKPPTLSQKARTGGAPSDSEI